ncbi:hypothetical protein ACHAW5_010284 [Stephanodiscus triporus]|uniref:START domain-containing protein n=1 Tax=Stephanodiscus triporus TaxID=2934178 RepID=A0ABD3P0R5_9STRA
MMWGEEKRLPRHPKRLFRRSNSAPAAHILSPDYSQRSSSFATSRPIIAAAAADDGRPSSSALWDLKRVLKMIEDERHLVARDLYVDARSRILDQSAPPRRIDNFEQNNTQTRWKVTAADFARDYVTALRGKKNENNNNAGEDEDMAARMLLDEKKEEFIALETLFGISTFYRRESSTGSLSVKIEGELHGVPLFEQLVVLRECDLYHTWAPFTSASRKLAQLTKLDVVAWFIVGVPSLGLTRDACYRAVGCDCVNESGSVLLVACGLNDTEEFGVKDGMNNEGTGNRRHADMGKDDEKLVQHHHTKEESEQQCSITPRNSISTCNEILSTLEIPPIPRGTGSGRMTIRNFSASIEILSPTAAATRMVFNIDPNLQLMPNFVIDFAMKRMCGIILSRLQAMARKAVNDPVKNPHARRIREDVRFYRDWLYPKFRLYCDERGWQMPKVGALEIEVNDLKAEGMGWIDDDIVNNAAKLAEASQLCRSEEVESGASPSVSIDSSSLHGIRSMTSSSNSSSKSLTMMKSMTLRRSLSQDDKIAAARTRAADRLRPEPFSKSKVRRLNELKVAKQKATEERSRKSIHMSGSVFSSCVASTPTLTNSNEMGEVKYSLLIFSCSLMGLSMLQRHSSFLSLTQLTCFTAHSFFDLTAIVLQAILLRALLNCVLFYAFEKVDFGQKILLKRMSHGKQLFITKVKKFTKYTSISALMASCLFGFPAGRMIRGVCSLPDFAVDHLETVSSPLIVASSWRQILASFDAIQLRVCETSPNVSEQWTSRALDMSSFIILRLGIFSVALVFMGSILSPKISNKNHGLCRTETDSRIFTGDSFEATGTGLLSVGSMEVIVEEDL